MTSGAFASGYSTGELLGGGDYEGGSFGEERNVWDEELKKWRDTQTGNTYDPFGEKVWRSPDNSMTYEGGQWVPAPQYEFPAAPAGFASKTGEYLGDVRDSLVAQIQRGEITPEAARAQLLETAGVPLGQYPELPGVQQYAKPALPAGGSRATAEWGTYGPPADLSLWGIAGGVLRDIGSIYQTGEIPVVTPWIREKVVPPAGDIGAAAFASPIADIPLGLIEQVTGRNVPTSAEVGRFAGETAVPANAYEIAATLIPAAKGFASGRAAGESMARAAGRGVLEGLAIDPTQPGGVARAFGSEAGNFVIPGSNREIANLGELASAAKDMRAADVHAAARNFGVDVASTKVGTIANINKALTAQNEAALGGAGARAAENLPAPPERIATLPDSTPEIDDLLSRMANEDATREFIGPGQPSQRIAEGFIQPLRDIDPGLVQERGKAWTDVLRIRDTAPDAATWQAADDTARSMIINEMRAAKGSIDPLEALSRNMALSQGPVRADFVTNPTGAGVRLAEQPEYQVVREHALRATDSVPNQIEPQWVARLVSGESADVPVAARSQLLAEAQRLGVPVDEQLVRVGTREAVRPYVEAVNEALEAERRTGLGVRGRAAEDLAASLSQREAGLERQVSDYAARIKNQQRAQQVEQFMALGRDGTPAAREHARQVMGADEWARLAAESRGQPYTPLARGGRATPQVTAGAGRNLPPSGIGGLPAMAGAAPSGWWQQPLGDKILDVLYAPFSIFGGDWSAIFRQGGFRALNPLNLPETAKVIANLARSTFSRSEAERIMANLGTLAAEKGVNIHYADAFNGRLIDREGQFFSRLPEKVPVVGKVYEALNRGFAMAINTQRGMAVDAFIRNFPTASAAEWQTYANYIERSTGRGSLGALEDSAKALGPMFSSLRYAVSIPERAAYLNPATRLADGSVEMFGPVWREAVKDHAAFFATGIGALALADKAGLKVGVDPRRSDFGTISVGNTKVDIWGGWKQYATAITTAASGQKIVGGKLETDYPALIGRDEKGNYKGAVAEFIRNKLGPTVSLGATGARAAGVEGKGIEFLHPDYWNKGVFGLTGETGKNLDVALQYVVPLWIQDVAQAVRAAQPGEGLTAGLIAGASAFTGLGVQSYAPSVGSERFTEREDFLKTPEAQALLPEGAKGKTFEALTTAEQGAITRAFNEARPDIAARYEEAKRASGDVFQATRDEVAKVKAEVFTPAYDTLGEQWLRGEVTPRDFREQLQGLRAAEGAAVRSEYETPAYAEAVKSAESYGAKPEPGKVVTDLLSSRPDTLLGRVVDIIGARHNAEPGQPATTPGEIQDVLDLWYELPKTMLDKKGEPDWNAIEQTRNAILGEMRQSDPLMAQRFEESVKQRVDPADHELSRFYEQAQQDAVKPYYGLPYWPPEGQSWSGRGAEYQALLDWREGHPYEEAMLYLLGYVVDLRSQEAGAIVREIAPGQAIKTAAR